jgi:hypothetical protein
MEARERVSRRDRIFWFLIERERHFLLDAELVLLKTGNRSIKERMRNLEFGSSDVEIF